MRTLASFTTSLIKIVSLVRKANHRDKGELERPPDFQVEFQRRGSQRIGTYLTPSNIVAVEEIYANVMSVGDEPSSHTNYSINIDKLIVDEIQMCINFTRATLGHPSLITRLCAQAGVDVSTPPLERPGQTINISYIKKLCKDKKRPWRLAAMKQDLLEEPYVEALLSSCTIE
ncbi:hypothetical protein Fmac_005546 [Flemingia macrophylla]|uniref:Uncharacterized protein n=1 Tax=Flemingia macrophylla TaxID=520843 RepID=A0ABD1N826_9FABA